MLKGVKDTMVTVVADVCCENDWRLVWNEFRIGEELHKEWSETRVSRFSIKNYFVNHKIKLNRNLVNLTNSVVSEKHRIWFDDKNC